MSGRAWSTAVAKGGFVTVAAKGWFAANVTVCRPAVRSASG
jgi:hypothetical protein